MYAGFAAYVLIGRLIRPGELSPMVVGGAALDQAVKELRAARGGRPFVFNLGHGVLPQTPPENVAALARLVAEPLPAS